MFHPSKYNQHGGDYTDIISVDANISSSISSAIVNISSLKLRKNLYGQIAESHPAEYAAIIEAEDNLNEMNKQHETNILQLTQNITTAASTYSSQYTAHISSYVAKTAAFNAYSNAQDDVSRCNTTYRLSSLIHTSTLSSLSTLIGNEISNSTMTGGAIDPSSISTYSGLVRESTIRGLQISTNYGNYITLSTITIPLKRQAYLLASTIYGNSISTYNGQVILDISDLSTYYSKLSTYNHISSSIEEKNIIMETTRDDYLIASALLNADDYKNEYISAVNTESAAYLIYNSTITSMRAIETIYNLVMSGLPVPTEIINTSGVQGGGYTPLYNIEPIVCNPSDSACMEKKNYLDKYINVHNTLSTAVIQYESTYHGLSYTRANAEKNTIARVNLLLKDALSELDTNYKNALIDIPIIEANISTNNANKNELIQQSTTQNYLIPSSLFTRNELNILLSNSMSGGGDTLISNSNLVINYPNWNVPYISTSNAALLASTSSSTTASGSSDPSYLNLLQTYLTTQAQLQMITYLSIAIYNANNKIGTNISEAQIHLSSLLLQKSSLEAQSTINASRLATYNLNSIISPAFIGGIISQRVSTLANFEVYSQNLNSTLKVKYSSEINKYKNIIAQISTYVILDIQKKIINRRITSTIISSYSSFSGLATNYINMLTNEGLYKDFYIYTKTIYEIESSHIAQGINSVGLMPTDTFEQLKFYYDIYVGECNTAINIRSATNTIFIEKFNAIKSTLEADTLTAITTNQGYTSTIGGIQRSISSTAFPYSMVFENIPTRGALFDRTTYIPQPKVPTCLSTPLIDGTPVSQSTLISPTTTLNSYTLGTTCQYIEISKPDNNIEILQVLAIDRFGRNVALGASVEIIPTSSSGAGNISLITNGAYTTNQDTISIPSRATIGSIVFSQQSATAASSAISSQTFSSEKTMNVLVGTNYNPEAVPSFPVVDPGTINESEQDPFAPPVIPGREPELPDIAYDNPISLSIDVRSNTLYSACRTGIFKGTTNTNMKVYAASNNYIYTIITDNDGNIYTVEDVKVGNTDATQIRKYPPSGGVTPILSVDQVSNIAFDLPPRSIDQPFNTNSPIFSPISYSACLAVNDNYLVFADFGNSRVCVFSKHTFALVVEHPRYQILGNPIGLIIQNNYIMCIIINIIGEFYITCMSMTSTNPDPPHIIFGDIYNTPYTITQSPGGVAYYSSGNNIYRLSVLSYEGVNFLNDYEGTPPSYTGTMNVIGMATKSDGNLYYVDGISIYQAIDVNQYGGQQGGVQQGGQQSINYYLSTDNPSTAKKITINLGAPKEITAIKYLKYNSSYSPVGMKFRLLNESRSQVGVPMSISLNLSSITFDLRPATLGNSEKISIPITALATRNGVCGIMGRYVKLSPSTNVYNYAISQISVISTSGQNLALNKKIAANIGGVNQFTNIVNLLNGRYTSLPTLQSFIATSTSINDYILIDLGNEYDITAVNLYYATQGDTSIINSGIISIYTADYMVAGSQPTTRYHTSVLKEIIDFRIANADLACPTSVRLSTNYGQAGVIARYILLSKAIGEIAFSKIEVIDKTGLDVAQFCQVHVSSGVRIKQRGVTNYSGPRLKREGYYSDSGLNNQWYYVDFGSLKEICYINLYGCTDSMNMTQGLVVSLYSTTPILSSSTPIVSFNAVGGVTTQGFDTRYEPDISTYPTSVQRSITRYGPLGVFAQSIYVYAGNLISPNFYVRIIDANGLIITPVSDTPDRTPITNIFYHKYTLKRMYEITSVITNLTGAAVELYDCYNMLVAQANSIDITPTGTNLGVYADFRNYVNGQPNKYAPIVPYRIRRGGYNLSLFSNVDPNSGVSRDSKTNSGVKARYIKIFPRDAVTPLYISQILVIDEFGINRALDKSCIYTSAYDSNKFPKNMDYAVDGVYEAQFDTLSFLNLFFTKYKRKQESESFVSTRGGENDANWKNDDNWFGIDIGLDITTDSSQRNILLGPEYAINSVIYVTSKDRGAEAEGVMVQLFDTNMNVVGAQMITNIASVFGVDILDFRADTSVSILYQPNQVEVRERIIQTGARGCGVMTQYVRIEQNDTTKPINLSQIAVTDPDGNNIAQYKPTYATSGNINSYKVVDGTLNAKYAADALRVNPGYNQYVEVNLGQEYEVTSIQLADIVNSDSSSGFRTLNAKLYNKYRDMIGSYKAYVPPAVLNTLSTTTTSSTSLSNVLTTSQNFLYLEKVGVQIANQLIPYKYNSGLLATASISSFSTITNVPSVLNINGVSCIQNINRDPKYTRVNGGIPTKYVRVYNVDNYIQISQIMVYDTNGVNVAYKKPATATTTLPGFYAQYATDGKGGFFHAPRNEPQCYISGNNRYDYWQVDLGQIYNIIAVRYIPPATNTSRNIGTRIQLIGTTDNIVIAEKVVSSPGDTTLDFRAVGSAGNINDLISPPISVLLKASSSGVQGISISNNTLCYVDSNKVYSATSTTSNKIYTGAANSGLTSIQLINTTLAIVDTNNNSIKYIDINTKSRTREDTIFNRPYSVTIPPPNSATNLFCISENKPNGNIYISDYTDLRKNYPIYTGSYILSILLISKTELLACVGDQIIKFSGLSLNSDSNGMLSKMPTNEIFAGYGSTCLPSLKEPAGLALDPVNKIVFISYLNPPSIYSVNLVTMATRQLGVGISVSLTYPQFLTYSYTTGYLYISDRNLGICSVDLSSRGPLVFSATTTYSNLFNTTTLLGNEVGINPISAAVLRPETYDTYKYTKMVRMLNEAKNIPGIQSCCVSKYTNKIYVCSATSITEYSDSLNGTLSNTQTLNLSNNLNITSMSASTTDLYLASPTNYIIYKLSISGLSSNTPRPYIGTISGIFSPDGTPIQNSYIIPHAVEYTGTTLYFTDNQPSCTLIRMVDSANNIQTLAGSNNIPDVPITQYYDVSSDLIRAEYPNSYGIKFVQITAILKDPKGYMYIADAGNNCIHRLTPYSKIQPVCGPFREDVAFLDTIGSTTIHRAYSVKINSPTGLAFDSNMNLICTSSNGCQIIRITNLNSIEPQVEVISGLGVDINNIQAYDPNPRVAIYADLNTPTSIAYSFLSNSLYFVDSGNFVLRQLTQEKMAVVYKGNNGILPYGLSNKLSITNCIYFTIHQNGNIYYINNSKNLFMYNPTTNISSSFSNQTGIIELYIFNQEYLICLQNNSLIISIDINNPNNVKTLYTDNNINHICVHENGCIFIAYSNIVKQIYIHTATIMPAVSLPSDGNTYNFGPICLDSNNNLFINRSNNNIQYALRFTYTPQDTSFSLIPSQALSSPITTSQPILLISMNSVTGGKSLYSIDNSYMYTSVLNSDYSVNPNYNVNNNSRSISVSNPSSIFYFNNNIYISNTGNNNIIRIAASAGSSGTDIFPRNSGLILSSPNGIYVNNNGIYVADTGNNRICLIPVNSVTPTYTIYNTPNKSPFGIYINSSIILYTSGNIIYKRGTGATDDSQIYCTSPNTLGKIYCDLSTNKIYTTDSNGNIWAIRDPLGIGSSSTGSLYLLHNINSISGIFIYNSIVYYTISNSNKIKTFVINPIVTYTQINTWALSGAAVSSIYADSKYLYYAKGNIIYRNIVVQSEMNNITGENIYGSSSGSTSLSKCFPLEVSFNSIKCINSTYENNIMVCDSNALYKLNSKESININNIYTAVGYTSISGNSGDGKIATLTQLNTPFGCSYDTNGNIYVADTNNNWIRRIDAASGIVSNITNKNLIDGVIDVQINSAGVVYALTPTQLYSITRCPSHYVVGSHYSIEAGNTSSIALKTIDSTKVSITSNSATIYFLKDMIINSGILIAGNVYLYNIVVEADVGGASLSLEYASTPSQLSYISSQNINITPTTITGRFTAISPNLYFRISGGQGCNLVFTSLIISSVDHSINTNTYAYNAPFPLFGDSSLGIINSVYSTQSSLMNARSVRIDKMGNIYISCSEKLSSNLGTSPSSAQISTANNKYTGVIRRIDVKLGVVTQFAGGFNECIGIAFDNSNNLHIVDYYKNILYKFSTTNPQTSFQDVSDKYSILKSNNYANSTDSNKPYGICVDSENNIYISCNNNFSKYSTSNANAHKIMKYDSNLNRINENFIGTGTAATSPYNYYSVSNSTAIVNPQYLSIDKYNRLLFTQSGLHSVLLVALSPSINSINNVSSVRIEIQSSGKSVSLNSCNFNGASSQPTISTSGTTSSTSLPFTSLSTDINPYILFTFNSPVSLNSIVLRADSAQTDAVGMRVLLFDSVGNLLSNRVTTNSILTTDGCTISYDTNTSSDS